MVAGIEAARAAGYSAHSAKIGGTDPALDIARIEAIEFRAPIKVGDVVRLTARLNAAFGTSMEIGVRVEREHAKTGKRSLCADARATFVNIGEDGKPCPVPPLLVETDEDRKLEAEAIERRRRRREGH